MLKIHYGHVKVRSLAIASNCNLPRAKQKFWYQTDTPIPHGLINSIFKMLHHYILCRFRWATLNRKFKMLWVLRQIIFQYPSTSHKYFELIRLKVLLSSLTVFTTLRFFSLRSERLCHFDMQPTDTIQKKLKATRVQYRIWNLTRLTDQMATREVRKPYISPWFTSNWLKISKPFIL